MAVKKFSAVAAPVDAALPQASSGFVAATPDDAIAAAPAQVPAPAPMLALAAPQTTSNQVPAEVTATMEKAMKTAEDFVSFGQGNVDAFVKAGQIWAAGVQDMGKRFAATAQAQMDQTVATMKAMAGVKSLKEAMELQSTLARASMEQAVAETGKLTETSMKLTEQAMAPITARVTLAMETFGRAV